MDTSSAAMIAGSDMSVSDKIRALAEAGYPRADIARVLGKRYQHVRNVLEADKVHPPRPTPRPASTQGQTGVEESPLGFEGVYRLNVEEDGIVRLPPDVRAALGARTGGLVIGQLEDDRFVILSVRTAAIRAQGLIAGLGRDPDRLLSEELIADRRAEAARADTGG